jgi:hypothetical protein
MFYFVHSFMAYNFPSVSFIAVFGFDQNFVGMHSAG